MKYVSLALVATLVAGSAFMAGCQKKEEPPKKSHRMLNAPSEAPKTVIVREKDGRIQYAEVDSEYGSAEEAIEAVNNGTLSPEWRTMKSNQKINQQSGFPATQQANGQQYFIQDPSSFQPHQQQPMGQNPYQYNPYQMAGYYTQQANQGMYPQNQGMYPGMQGYYGGGGYYAPWWGWGYGGYGYAYGYGYGYYNYPNYYGCGGCGAYNHYYPYYYYPYPNYAYQPCYYWNSSYYYYYPYGYYPYGGYNYYVYAGWWF